MAEASLAERERSGIYAILNTVTGKRYIGSAKCFRTRWNAHRAALNKGLHHSKHLQSAWNKHGAEAFVFTILEFCEHQKLIAREQSHIDALRPAYNVCQVAGSTLGRVHSSSTKLKIAQKALGRKCPPRSAEHRAAISASLVGKRKSEAHAAAFQAGRATRVYSEEQKLQVSESLKAAYASGLRSRVKSEEHRQKIGRSYAKLSDAQVREIRSLRLAGVTCKELAERFGSNAGTICEIASRKRYRWVD
jgi:group I intron endonuclease